MKISNETKVGILTITGLTILILGFNYLKGRDMFSHDKKIYAVFSNLGYLSKSNEVKINGLVIGKVYDLNAKDKNINGIVATINLTRDVNIPRDSKASISSPLIGSSQIVVEKGVATDYLQPGDTLQTKVDSGILDDVKAQLTPTLTKFRLTLDSLNIVLGSMNKVLNSDAKDNLQHTMANLSQASNSLNALLDLKTGPMAKTLNNAVSITESLKKNTDTFTTTLSNAKKFSERLARIQLQPTIDSLNTAISLLKGAIKKIASKDGTLGALINDKAIYNKLYDAILSAEILIDDLRAHPKRYVNISLFGKKDTGGALTSPSKKDSIPK